MKNIKWLFFDIGYTLINEDDVHRQRVIDTVKNQNVYTYEDVYNAMIEASGNYKQPYPTAIEQLGIKYYAQYKKELEKPYKCAKNVLKKLHKYYKIGIIANQSEGTEQRLIEYGLREHIDYICASAESGLSKPDINMFLKALEDTNCAPENAVMIGDRLDNDIFPANKIGMKTI